MKKMTMMLDSISQNKKLKWAYRYVIYSIFVAVSLFVCGYSIITLVKLSSMTSGTAFVEMALDNFLEAQSLIAYTDRFRTIMIISIITSILLIAGLVLSIIYIVKWQTELEIKRKKRAVERAAKNELKKRQEEQDRIAREQAAVRMAALRMSQSQPMAPPQSPMAPPQPVFAFCPHCGKRYEGGLPVFCGGCGRKIR